MTPLQRIREDPGKVRDMLVARGFDAPLDRILELDRRARELRAEVESLNADRNKASRGGPPSDEVKARMREVGEKIKSLQAELTELEAERDEKLLWIPNEIDPRVPGGKDEHDNTVVRKDEPKKLDLVPRPHWELGEALGILDIPRGTKLSGSRFYVLRGAGAALQRALIAWMIDLKIPAGFTEIYPPFVTRRETLIGSAHLPHFDENLYRDEDDDVWLVPTAEPQLVGLHRDETLEAADLPRRYVAYTACFRREHMSAGRDVRGIKRGHEFDKVEMVVHCAPEESPEWLEVSSASNCGSFQSERSNIRFRREAGARPEHVHILNASGVALPRLMIAIMENYQRTDGSLEIPRVVRSYMGGREKIAPGEFSL